MFHVRDRGVGFDMAHAGDLFGPFRRLHPASQFEGMGIGLALVRKIVQRHGGRVWAQSQPGAGTTISFSLPVPPAGAQHVVAAGEHQHEVEASTLRQRLDRPQHGVHRRPASGMP